MEKNYDHELAQYVSLKTGEKPIPEKDPFSRFEQWYQWLLSHWKKEVRNSEEMVPIGMRSINLLRDCVSEEAFKKAVNNIFLWQLMTRRHEIDGLLTEKERIEKSATFVKSPEEREHFVQETRNLGDQAKDILGEPTYQMVDFTPPPERKKRTR